MARATADVKLKQETSGERLFALRAELAKHGLAGFVVPRADEHQGEYVAPRSERLAWLTGFTGSAGAAVVLLDKAAVFVDGRYTLQACDEVDIGLFEIRHLIESPPAEWIAANLPRGTRLGFDPWLHAENAAKSLAAACEKAGAELVPCAVNPLDAVWRDQPEAPHGPAVVQELRFAGRSSAEKRADIADAVTKAGAEIAVLTAPDSINWLLNIRGSDLAFTPVALAFALIDARGKVALFVDKRKITDAVRAHLGADVTIDSPEILPATLGRLGKKAVLIDPQSAAAFVFNRLREAGARIVTGADPCALPKACKNEIELRGTTAAHIRDGAALTRFLAWIAREAPKGNLDEISAAAKLESFRRENEYFRGLSFPTISGTGSNGAVVHYRASERTKRKIAAGEIYLVDSGAQYLDGTTDVTRAVFISGKGEPSAEQRDRFTRVLKGHIAIATAKYPRGTSGGQLDALARRALWEAGIDYDHGTGHGVGSYLGVHEGPQRIAKIGSDAALRTGMIVSNEPGYYKAGAYGIRLENLVTVVAVEDVSGAERELLGFETITLAPFDRALIDRALLTEDEIAWVDSYHARVRETLSPLVDAETADWLKEATNPL
ncbi:MAG: aminopeptidase P family protein [Alphaproteobacteria bacterium]